MFSEVTLQNVYMYGENTIAAIRSVIGALWPPLWDPLNWPVGDVRAAVKHVKDHAKTAAVCFMRRICWLVRDYIAAGYLSVACGGSGGAAWARNRAGRPSRSVGETQGSRASCARYLYFSTPWGGILEIGGTQNFRRRTPIDTP